MFPDLVSQPSLLSFVTEVTGMTVLGNFLQHTILKAGDNNELR